MLLLKGRNELLNLPATLVDQVAVKQLDICFHDVGVLLLVLTVISGGWAVIIVSKINVYVCIMVNQKNSCFLSDEA